MKESWKIKAPVLAERGDHPLPEREKKRGLKSLLSSVFI